MIYRDVDILASQVVADSGTKTVDLDVTDPITELEVLLGLTNGASHNVDKIPTRIISKIELVDGGTVFASLSGEELAADFFYNAGKYPPHWYDETVSLGQSVSLPMLFGRYLGDPLRNFDPTKLRNPQIKVTWSKDTLHLTGTISLGVRAKVLTDVPGASSCLLTKSVRSFTTAASGIEPTDLPTDYPIRRLYVKAYLAGNVPASILSHFKLDCDQGKFIPFDWSGWDLCEDGEKQFGYAHIRRVVTVTDGDYREAFVGNAFGGSAQTESGSHFVNAFCSGNPMAWFHVKTDAGAAGTDIKTEWLVYGCLPHSVFAYQFGLKDDSATWLNAAAYRNLKLSLTQGAASADCNILVQQDRPI